MDIEKERLDCRLYIPTRMHPEIRGDLKPLQIGSRSGQTVLD
jgi:hypothetical protein